MKKNILYRALQLIPQRFKRKGLFIVFLLTLSSLLDLFSLASFLPVIILIIKPEQLSGNHYLSKIYTLSGFNDPVHFSIALTLLALLFILFKTQINIWITHKKASFGYAISSVLAGDTLNRFLYSPHQQFINADYTRELNRITHLPLMFANNLILPAGTILSEALITIMLFSAIAIYDIKLFIFLSVLVIPVIWLYRMKRKGIKQTSEQIKTTYPLALKYTLQSIEGLVEIKTFQKEEFFKHRADETYSQLGKTFAKDHTRNTSISRTTELIAAVFVGLLIIYVMLYYRSKEDAILLLSIYAGVSFRSIPSINRIFSSFVQIKAYEYVVEELGKSKEQVEQSGKNTVRKAKHSWELNSKPLTFEQKIQLKNISFGYENNRLIFNDLSLTIHKGAKIIISGKSGNGKTTLLLLLMRFLKEQKGEILLDDKKVEESDATAFRKLIGYVPQNPYILDATISENIAFGIAKESIDLEKVKQLILDLDLAEWVDSLPDKLNTVIGEKGAKISGGQRQRLAIARALYHDAEILLLDEITNQVHSSMEQQIWNMLDQLTEKKKSIILVTHKLPPFNSVDAIYSLENGKLIETVDNDQFTSSISSINKR